MQPRDLITTARRLVGRGRKGKPRQSDLKRAMSTAYYAMFHALCRNCADCLVGKTTSNRSQAAWTQAYRAIEHGYSGRQCGKKAIDKFPGAIQDFASKFIELQEKRHYADYDPNYRLTRSEVLTDIRSAEVVIKNLHASSSKDRTAFAVWTVMKKRA